MLRRRVFARLFASNYIRTSHTKLSTYCATQWHPVSAGGRCHDLHSLLTAVARVAYLGFLLLGKLRLPNSMPIMDRYKQVTTYNQPLDLI